MAFAGMEEIAMAWTSEIKEHMRVVDSDGGHLGTVDRVKGSRLKLTRDDPASGAEHHYLHLAMVAAVESGAARLTRTAAHAG